MEKLFKKDLIVKDCSVGLSNREVERMIAKGFLNKDTSPKPKSLFEIFKSNFFTLFNFINLILAILILFTASFRNLMFMIVVLCNSTISLMQEFRARRATEKLKLMAADRIKVVRESRELFIDINQVVMGDIIIYERGVQIVADCEIILGECEVNESFLTGESDLISKKEGDMLFSGSYVVGGYVKARALKVGENTFSSGIAKKLKNIEIANSEIMLFIKKIIRIISIIVISVGIPIFLNQLRINSFNYSPAALNTCAAVIGMIPEGLALLTSSVLALGALKLMKKKILSKDIYSIEILAGVNMVCLDKTGTITEGKFETVGIITQEDLLKKNSFTKIHSSFSNKNSKLTEALRYLSSSLDDNSETFSSIKKIFYRREFKKKPDEYINFCSEKKFSAIYLENKGSFVLGSLEFIFKNIVSSNFNEIKKALKNYENYRVLAVGFSRNKINKKNIPNDTSLLGFVLLRDKIRKNIQEVLDFFKTNSIKIKIISGDSLESVSKISKTIKIKENDINSIDVSEINGFSEILNSVTKYDIFCRTTPEKKREIIKALKIKGFKVAMIGDGVNDILALKEADCSITMAHGSSAAKEIAHLILINSNFSSIPFAISEGRRAINNIKTTSSLFLVKTIYSIILSLLILIFAFPYPFMPIQMSLIGALTIGIPSSLLAFEVNIKKVSLPFFHEVIKKALPTAIVICINLVICFVFKNWFSLDLKAYSSISLITTIIIGIAFLKEIMNPLNLFRKLIFSIIIATFLISIIVFHDIFLIYNPIFWGLKNMILTITISALSLTIYKLAK
ncbi:MAG: HAD-IC family P-type ATPase [Candidatus Improbicoccus pseudotrichonymphae]|uniref:HAD-IC family P-type ATPase n=1 Tax=Candidatus Improbicoccus pseudotrichonymphae TaxID=3033792 RepID=A0AA48I0W5_9FIRM|nr:MAG: HAD-IC family P-type ATPase [Candidatus Improbicoccus pseudotrichonymphae]